MGMNTQLLNALETFPGQFELHLSVAIATDAELGRFEEFCRQQGARALVIRLARGLTPRQPMLSLQLEGAPDAVYKRIQALTEALVTADFSLQRLKVEASIFNQGLPQTDSQAAAYAGYFEHHLKLNLSPDELQDLSALSDLLNLFGGHLSANALKDSPEQRFVTQRVKAGERRACWELDKLMGCCRARGLSVSKQVREYIIYDSCLELDAGWIEA